MVSDKYGKKCYACNCGRCGRLHIWSIKTAKDYNLQYRCVECELINIITKSDLM